MNEQQIRDLFLGIDVLIAQRINNPNDTFEQFNERRERIINQTMMAMKIKNKPKENQTDNTQVYKQKCEG